MARHHSSESTDPDIDIRTTDWKYDRATLFQIRRSVFIEEQNVPEGMECDEFDEVSIHFLVTNNGNSIATARLKPDGQIGRMAVLKKSRNQGVGNRLLTFILKTAIHNNLTSLYLHAQVTAIPFYEKHGFITYGEVFYEAGIAHKEMRRVV